MNMAGARCRLELESEDGGVGNSMVGVTTGWLGYTMGSCLMRVRQAWVAGHYVRGVANV